MYKTYNRTRHEGERLWKDMKMEFRMHTIKEMSRAMITEWTDFVIHRGIYIDELPGLNRHKALSNMISRSHKIPAYFDDEGILAPNTWPKRTTDKPHINDHGMKCPDRSDHANKHPTRHRQERAPNI